METTITAYNYSDITQKVNTLVSAYLSVNDSRMRRVIRDSTIAEIQAILPTDNPITEAFLERLKPDRLTREAAAALLPTLEPLVDPFPDLTPKQLSKLFRKVKKLKQPEWASVNRHQLTYLGWNDGGNQKKYLVAPYQGKLIGIQGDMGPKTVKNLCAICHTIGNVSLFVSTTKRSGLGTYTRNGNYICRDSDQCNRQLTDPQALAEFIETVRSKR